MLYAVQGPAPERNSSLTLVCSSWIFGRLAANVALEVTMMACRTISLQSPLAFKDSKDNPRKNPQGCSLEKAEGMQFHTYRATLARSCAVIRVSLERKEHHGPREVTVVGRTLSQSSIRSRFCGPAIFRAKAPARTPCSYSFPKGKRMKAHVRIGPRSIRIHRFE
jgi:hypothetical protein